MISGTALTRNRALVGVALGALVVAACANDSEGQSESTVATEVAESESTEPQTSESVRAAETTEPEPAQTTEPETADTTEPAETTEPEPEPVILDFSEVDAVVSSFVEERGLNGAGLAVVDPAGVVHEQYWGEFDPDRISLVASSSKQLTAGVMLALQDQGLLDVDAPLNEIVGDAWGPGVPEITVAQMVSNSSGLVGLGRTSYVVEMVGLNRSWPYRFGPRGAQP